MKNFNKILKIILISFFSIFIFINKLLAEEENYESINFEQLLEIKNNEEALSEVKYLSIEDLFNEKQNQIVNNIHLIELLPNVERIYINATGLHLNKNFFELIKTSKKFTLSLAAGSIDLENAHNDNLKEFYLSEHKVYNFEDIINFTNLELLSVDIVSGFKTVDFRQSNLKKMEVRAQTIENYEDFFNKVSKIKELSLENSNITNSDMKYIKKMSNLTFLSLAGTYVTDISFLDSVPTLEDIFLPYDLDSFDVLYKLPNLKSVWFDSLTEIKLSNNQDLLNYFSKKNILYTSFDNDIYDKFNNIISSLNVLETDTDLEKIGKVKNFVLDYMHADNSYHETEYSTTIDRVINYRRGVCHDYSILTYTLLKAIGIDVYFVNGSAKDLFEGAEKEYDKANPHAWNMVHVGDNWYGMDITWMECHEDLECEYMERTFYLKNTYFDYSSDVYPYYHNDEEHYERYFALSHVTQNNPMDSVKQEFKLIYTFPENEENTCDFKYIYAKDGTKWGTLCSPQKIGYSFAGWYSSIDQSKITKDTVATRNEVVVPRWELIIPSIDESTGYVVNDNYIIGNFYGKTSDEIDLKLDDIYQIRVINKDNTLKTNDKIVTGDKIQIYLDNTKVVEYKVVIMGDTSGDGKVNYIDYVNIYNHIKKSKNPRLTNKKLLTEEYFIAADMNEDNKITYMDYVKVYQYIKKLKQS